MVNDQGELALSIELDEKGNPVQVCGYGNPQRGNEFTTEEKRDLFLAASLNEEKTHDDEGKLMLDAYLTDRLGNCDFDGKEQLYERVGDKVAKPSAEEQSRRQGIEQVLLTEKIEDDKKRTNKTISAHHRGYIEPKEGSPKEVCYCPQCTVQSQFATKKYKPVALKVKPVMGTLPDKFRIERKILGDPLAEMPKLNPRPPEFEPKGRYTQERKEAMDKVHAGDFLLPEERKLIHHLIAEQNEAFAWDDTEHGRFREDMFPVVEMPVIEHVPWALKNIPIPPGLYDEVCKVIKTKIDAGVYEPSNSSYRSRWFCVVKKDGKSLRLVHSLEPLNKVTIAHSGLPPATEVLAEQFAGRACGGMFDLYVGYDERPLAVASRDYTTFQTPYGALRLVTLPMGWTNSVPIFHDDVTFILQEEIPHVTVPYIDDVPVKGPKTRYESPDGSYETIPENSGIRRFVWEHVNNVNRVLQQMKYCGGTFSRHKSVICAEEITVVGHRCGYNGRTCQMCNPF